jgi:hypothetical protein
MGKLYLWSGGCGESACYPLVGRVTVRVGVAEEDFEGAGVSGWHKRTLSRIHGMGTDVGFVEPRVNAAFGQAGVESPHGVTVRMGMAEAVS